MSRHARLLATGRYLPEQEITNDDLREQLGRHDPALPGLIDQFEAASGIRTRFHAPADWATSDLAVAAARDALQRAGLSPTELDLIVLGTDTPDYLTPATSVVVQHKLGATRAGTFDVGCACASFPTGLAIGAALLATQPWLRHVLVLGAYLMQRLADPCDPVSFYYGDGAGAALLGVGDEPGLLASAFAADGAHHLRWGVFAGGTAEPASVEAVQAGRTQVRLREPYPPTFNLEGWPRLMQELAARGSFRLAEVDLALFTQVRLPTICQVMAALELPMTRTHWVMDRWGYTGSACLAMALDEVVRTGRVQPGDLVTLVGSGVGANLAGVALRI